jgi:hypothetical protein
MGIAVQLNPFMKVLLAMVKNSPYNNRFFFLAALCLLLPVYLTALELPESGLNSLNYHTYLDDVVIFPAADNRISKTIELSDFFELLLVYPHASISYNSAYPRGQNDGALWQGRGANYSAYTGAVIQTSFFRLALVPTIYWSDNLDFPFINGKAETNYYSNTWYIYDYVQRYGETAYRGFDLGWSDLRFFYKSITLGFSHDSIWLGPSIINPIILAPNAPGFFHLDIGTLGAIPTKIGLVEARTFWGVLDESDYFDENANNDSRLITGLSMSYSPKWFSEFSFGFNRVFTTYWVPFTWAPKKFFQLWEPFFKSKLISNDNPKGLDEADQIFSITGEYNGMDDFRFYFEWARNDHALNVEYFLLAPENSHAFTLGFAKTYTFPSLDFGLQIAGEITSTEGGRTAIPVGPWYIHNDPTQGYTNSGQLLGAGIGSGASSQYVSLGAVGPVADVALYAYRVKRNNDVYIKLFAPWHRDAFIDVEMSIGIESSFAVSNHFRIFCDGVYSKNFNRDFRLDYTVDGEGNVIESELDNDIENFSFRLGARYFF